jgi:predicted N-acetyltransferase YhbS
MAMADLGADIEIRAARPHEAAALTRLARRAKGHWGYAAAQLDAWRIELTVRIDPATDVGTFVAEIYGAIGAFYQLGATCNGFELEHFYVDPRHMRRGVGRALLGHALDQVAARGASALLIDSDPHAEGFYRAQGASPVGAIAAPIAGEPARMRPLLSLAVAEHHGP